MPIVTLTAADALARLATSGAAADGGRAFDAVIDARSESEYALDRLPGAVNWPSLTDGQRALIGTEYAQLSPFAARKHGAVLVARNIAAHVERELDDAPKGWQPLVYCWRGGHRSGALAAVLGQIGFRVHVLDGGYREYRRCVLAALEVLPTRLDLRVVCGTTGSGKSRLLKVLAARGAQVLDLEALANHRGSVLGGVPDSPQPSQKQFDSRLWQSITALDVARPAWIESESKKVGELRVPEALIRRMRAARCVRLELPVDARVRLLMEDYDFFVRDVAAFCERLDALRALRGNETIDGWQAAARGGEIERVVRELLLTHYDPGYLQSMQRNFAGFADAAVLQAPNGDFGTLDEVADALLK